MNNLILTTVLALSLSIKSIASKKSPNIVFIVADDYGFGDIGYHGAEFATPNLDKLAAAGVKLENYYVQPICSPSRSQLMTSRYQIHTGLQHSIIWPSQPYGLPLKDPTMADFLRGSGYSTHAVGKWHLGLYKIEHTPLHRGFDSFYGYWAGGEDYYNYYNCDVFHNRTVYADDESTMNLNSSSNVIGQRWCGYDLRDGEKPVTDKNGTYSTHLYTNKSIEVIKKAAESDKPLFLYLAYQAVHSPMEAPPEYIAPYAWIKDKYRRTYAGMTNAMDEGVGNVTRALKEYGMWENTIIVFTTDNGGEILAGGYNWPLRGYKHTLWEGGVHGICFVTGPVLQHGGRISEELMHISDWLPTMAGMLEVKLNSSFDHIDGKDMWPMISQGKASPRTEILHNIDIWFPLKGDMLYNDTFDTRVRAALRVGDYKLITGNPGDDRWVPPPHLENNVTKTLKFKTESDKKKNVWLFNIKKDPWEIIDLSSSMPGKVREMLITMASYNATALTPSYPPSDPNCNPKLHGNFWGPWE